MNSSQEKLRLVGKSKLDYLESLGIKVGVNENGEFINLNAKTKGEAFYTSIMIHMVMNIEDSSQLEIERPEVEVEYLSDVSADINGEINDRGFVKAYNDYFNLYFNKNITKSDMMVIQVIKRYAKKDTNVSNLLQDEIAKLINRSRQTVNRSIAKLRKLGILSKVRNGRYALNPNILYERSTAKRSMAISKFYRYWVKDRQSYNLRKLGKLMRSQMTIAEIAKSKGIEHFIVFAIQQLSHCDIGYSKEELCELSNEDIITLFQENIYFR